MFKIIYAAFAAIFIFCFQVPATAALESHSGTVSIQNENDGFYDEAKFEESEVVEEKSTKTQQVSLFEELIAPARFTLNHEFSYKTKSLKKNG
mmetsp:Transcript_26309/g.12362  ORF Transcript_26309/g.12362 Transcript_26309/m.12362 type:complete len:93 (+) Transcript_26309:819-1097(+)